MAASGGAQAPQLGGAWSIARIAPAPEPPRTVGHAAVRAPGKIGGKKGGAVSGGFVGCGSGGGGRSHRDALLAEMAWLAADYAAERAWKVRAPFDVALRLLLLLLPLPLLLRLRCCCCRCCCHLRCHCSCGLS